MPLQAIHDKLEDIPEQYQSLYTEKGGKFELTGIVGVKTQADIDRLQTALNKERDEHKGTKTKYSIWDDFNHEEVIAKLDKFPELEAAAAGKLDDAKIEEIVTRRTEGTIRSKLAPVERENGNLKKQNQTLSEQLATFQSREIRRTIHDHVREALTKAKIIPEAQEDALIQAERVFEVQEDGSVVTKDNVGVTPGIAADVWLQEIQPKRPHWWPMSQGGGGKGGGGGGNVPNNPWSDEHWNLTQQGQILRTQGREKAEQYARAAGTVLGGARPKSKK